VDRHTNWGHINMAIAVGLINRNKNMFLSKSFVKNEVLTFFRLKKYYKKKKLLKKNRY